MSWAKVLIDEISTVVTKGTTPTTFGKDFTDEGVTFIKAESLNGDSNLSPQGFSFIDEETHEQLRRSRLAESDVLITIAGAQIGKCGYVRAEHLPANTNQAVGIIRINPEKAVPRFVYYYFKQATTFAFIQSLSGQAAQPNINLSMLKRIEIPSPSYDEQKRIAEILLAYDDLIENNLKRIALLEDSARQLYKEWFVRLRFPGHEHTCIVDGVPEGWEEKTIPEVIDIDPKTNVPKDGEKWFVEMASLPSNSMVISKLQRRTGNSGSRFQNGDTLFARITPCLENGKTGFVDFLAEGETAFGSTEFIVLRPKRVPAEYVYCLSRTYDFRENAIKNMVGSSGRQRVKVSCFNDYLIALPPQTLLGEFKSFASSCFRQIRNLSLQNQKLKQARDLLLPRLMSGEIPV